MTGRTGCHFHPVVRGVSGHWLWCRGWGLWPVFRHTESIKETSEMTQPIEYDPGRHDPPPVLSVHHAALQEIDKVVGNELTLDEDDTTRLRGILFAALSDAEAAPTKRKLLRCRLGIHRWTGSERKGWRCDRCGKEAKRCRNCGGQHDPDAYLVVCRVITGG